MIKKAPAFILVLAFCFFSKAQVVKFSKLNGINVVNAPQDTLAFPFAGGLNAPMFSNIDFDSDGIQDLFVFDKVGERVYCFLYKNNSWIHAPEYEVQFPKLYKWALLRDYNCDGKPDIFTEVDLKVQWDSSDISNGNQLRIIRNISTEPGKLAWKQDKKKVYDLGIEHLPPSPIGMQFEDLSGFEDMDGDGDLDIILMPATKNVITYYQNLSKERGFNCDSLLFQFRDECWGYMSYKVNINGFVLADSSPCWRVYNKAAMHVKTTLCPFDEDGDGDMDIIYGDAGFNDALFLKNGKTVNSKRQDSFILVNSNYPNGTRKISVQTLPAGYIVDFNADGKKDLLLAPYETEGAKNRDMVLAYQNGAAKGYQLNFLKSDFLVGEMIDLGGSTVPRLADLDADGDNDLIIATQGDFQFTQNSWDRLVYYENIGSNQKAMFQLKDTNFLKINDGAEKIMKLVPTFGDLNADGKPDMLVGDLNGKFHFYLNNSSNGIISFNKISNNYFGMYGGTFATPQLIDLNKDGKLDVVMGRKHGTLAYFENNGTPEQPLFNAVPTIDTIGKFTVGTAIISPSHVNYFDGYSSPHVCDLDNDGAYEVLVGSHVGKVHLFRNFEANATRKCEELTGLFSNHTSQATTNLTFGTGAFPFVTKLSDSLPNALFIGHQRGGIELFNTKINGIISSVSKLYSPIPSLIVYPNPTKDILYLQSSVSLIGWQCKLLSFDGKIVHQADLLGYEQILSLNQAPGIYLLVLEAPEGNSIVKKVVIHN